MWCLESPSLLADNFEDFTVIESLDSSLILDGTPLRETEKALAEHLSQSKSHFLGPYFELLWKYYLTHHPSYKLIASNLQIHEKGKTIGEFDFLVYDTLYQEYLHQELAVKFYLGYPSGKKALWIGPQTVDRLDKKMDRLLTHQLTLSELPAAKSVLQEMNIHRLKHQLLMKGYLFQPAHLNDLPLPDYVNPNCLKGRWIPLSIFKEQILGGLYENAYWKELSKLEWMIPYCSGESSELLSNPFESDIDFSRPILLSRLTKEAHLFIEEEKLFVVADNWPHLTKAAPAL